MKTIRTRISSKSLSGTGRIRTRSSYSTNRVQSITAASSRYNQRQNSPRNLNVIRQQFFEDDDGIIEGDEMDSQRGDEMDSQRGDEMDTQRGDEMDTQSSGNDEPLFDFEETFQNFPNKIIEERNLNASYNGDYGPYFPNATTFMLFTWCTKHMISKYYKACDKQELIIKLPFLY